MTALVTGAGKRLGREIALYLAGRGHNVAIHYNGSAEDAAETVAAARALGVRAEAFHTDLLDLDATEALIPAVTARLGALTVLVNNASIFEYDNLHSATRKSWDRHFGSNLRAPFILTQAFAAQVPPADRSGGEPVAQGVIINMVDQRVLKPTPEFMTYSLAKAGLWALTRTSAQALAPDVRVNAIGPGPTMQGTRQSAEHFARQRQATILERGSDARDVVAAIGFLLDAASVTGQLICTDGGQHLAWKTPDILGVE
ncbi:SDR family oxidoreductase [Paracoccus aminophilus]|uniref:Short-chain dehydrogenase/reductase SDR n=1 Tax=Paracoccus aminophilus JCM 7686 TaxID=1367847 RepID=S5YY31_PARAH|nr:SDR family oxidoreductase [Paracoccus aminophilus]AGT10081.1 short-chain dehydrogenase/reductase SDR [Paracoccus aminophilus JCM 7686]